MSNLEGWNSKRLSDLIDGTFAGEWGDSAAGDQNDIPVLRSTNFTHSGIIDYSNIVIRNIPEKKRIQKVLKKGDILLEKSGGSPSQPVGRVVYFERDTSFLYSNFTQKLTPSSSTQSKYLFYKMYFEYQNGLVLRYQQQTTGIINFQLSEYLNLKVEVPPLQEQKKIAAILTSVDEVIESTQAQINKLKDIKTSMIQELLTKGIDHTEFKDSPVGKIPKEWEVVKFDNIATSITCGVAAKPEYVDPSDGVPFLSAQNVADGKVLFDKFQYISVEAHKKLTKNTKPEKGDILYSRVGAKFGEAAIIEFDWEFSVYVSLTLIKIPSSAHNYFIKYLLNSYLGKEQAKSGVYAGGGVPNLNVGIVKEFLFAIPPIKEQKAISKILTSIDSKIDLTLAKLESIQSLKKALMQDLLTGKVRVKVS